MTSTMAGNILMINEMEQLSWRVSRAVFIAGILTTRARAQKALSWHEIRDQLNAANPTLRRESAQKARENPSVQRIYVYANASAKGRVGRDR